MYIFFPLFFYSFSHKDKKEIWITSSKQKIFYFKSMQMKEPKYLDWNFWGWNPNVQAAIGACRTATLVVIFYGALQLLLEALYTIPVTTHEIQHNVFTDLVVSYVCGAFWGSVPKTNGLQFRAISDGLPSTDRRLEKQIYNVQN